MSQYAITLTVNADADSPDDAAEAFGWYVTNTKHYAVIVDNLDNGESTEVEL